MDVLLHRKEASPSLASVISFHCLAVAMMLILGALPIPRAAATARATPEAETRYETREGGQRITLAALEQRLAKTQGRGSWESASFKRQSIISKLLCIIIVRYQK